MFAGVRRGMKRSRDPDGSEEHRGWGRCRRGMTRSHDPDGGEEHRGWGRGRPELAGSRDGCTITAAVREVAGQVQQCEVDVYLSGDVTRTRWMLR